MDLRESHLRAARATDWVLAVILGERLCSRALLGEKLYSRALLGEKLYSRALLGATFARALAEAVVRRRWVRESPSDRDDFLRFPSGARPRELWVHRHRVWHAKGVSAHTSAQPQSDLSRPRVCARAHQTSSPHSS